mmetsp:Transcript_8464/g.25072  ORF Transcript_8464/g.25072 Transcript_8464/m.25072 type:complete len:203 (+) Transcript_8464:1163-1771(+)
MQINAMQINSIQFNLMQSRRVAEDSGGRGSERMAIARQRNKQCKTLNNRDVVEGLGGRKMHRILRNAGCSQKLDRREGRHPDTVACFHLWSVFVMENHTSCDCIVFEQRGEARHCDTNLFGADEQVNNANYSNGNTFTQAFLRMYLLQNSIHSLCAAHLPVPLHCTQTLHPAVQHKGIVFSKLFCRWLRSVVLSHTAIQTVN